MEFIKKLFHPSDKYKGVLPIQMYVLKLFFLLMFLFAGKDSWTELILHQGYWNAEIGIAWCSIAAYTSLSIVGGYSAR